MSKKNEKVAFVAMKFTGDPWSDKRYIITEVLEEAGYVVRRGDELQSSGEAIREVLAFLREADLVVIDASGDSHNVSYEIGYCHGVARPPSETILLRSTESAVRFNYAHYRHIVYRDHRHLRRALRHRLNLTVPLADDQLGYVFAFDKALNAGYYGPFVAEAVISILAARGFTGRSEYYAGDPLLDPNLYVVGVGLQATHPTRQLSSKWWEAFVNDVFAGVTSSTNKLTPARECSEFSEMRAIRSDLLARGVADWRKGKVTHVHRINEDSDPTPFEQQAQEKAGEPD